MYGQTTSGKTFTMLGTPNSPGLLPCALRDIFSLIQKEKNPQLYHVHCSYIEIYNENLHDLLTDSNNLKLVDDNKFGVIVSGAKRVKINSFEDGITLKDFGEENRKYRETLINEYSSRSHTIFQIFIETEYLNSDNVEGVRYSCLNLVDLAGSERLNDYDTKTEAFGETGYINKSLFVLANVVNKLAENKNSYIPYRDSKLTRLLSQALGGNSLTAVICTVSPAAVNYYQTLSTLRFATRAKIVKTKPSVNEYIDDKGVIEFYKNEVKKLQEELKSRSIIENNKSNYGLSASNFSNEHIPANKELLEHIIKTNESLSNELGNYKEMYLLEKDRNDKIKNEIEKLKMMNNFGEEDKGRVDRDNEKNRSGKNFNPINKNMNSMSPISQNYDYPSNIESKNFKQSNSSSNFMNNFPYDGNKLNYKKSDDNQTLNNELNFNENLVNSINPYVEKSKNFNYWMEESSNLIQDYK
jgi:hypothetical protein